ncbi:isoprenyl transferase [Natroniella sp. ANB-PHB2]|uniref:isoprenyl transferase n=1 Tax=Natroniella sp. ANB-PHB2 TaxID=3384444 RepID=UPI0038D3C39E
MLKKLIDKLVTTNNKEVDTTFDNSLKKVKQGPIPEHVAIIMDGNGRWAKQRGLPRTAGHQAGVDSLKEVIECAAKIGIDHITAYTFSTENWKRPQREVDFLMNLFQQIFEKELEKFNQQGVKVKVIGYKDRLPNSVRKKAEQVMKRTGDNQKITVNIALDYGGRAEIIEMIKNIAIKVKHDQLKVEEIDEAEVAAQLYTANQPDPALLIRPGGEERISNFLLWQIAYAELYFTQTYWPDFTAETFLEAIADFQNRERRFGGLKEGRC